MRVWVHINVPNVCVGIGGNAKHATGIVDGRGDTSD